jgi:Arc/MetJ-type ribon-helix-helix transcriptional regulator
MTIQLPPRLENPILAAVHSGRYASLDDAMTEAAAMLVERLEMEQALTNPSGSEPIPDPVLGSMREDADLLDEIVEHAMKNRREQPWRLSPSE